MSEKTFKRAEISTRLLSDSNEPYIIDIEQIESICSSRPGIKQYAYIIHDQDTDDQGQPIQPHIHLMLNFGGNSYTAHDIAAWFQTKPQNVENIKGRWADAIAYLTHANAPDKYQYDTASVRASFDVNQFISQHTKQTSEKAVERLISAWVEQIVDGEIRLFNLIQSKETPDGAIPAAFYNRFANRFEKALKMRAQVLLAKQADRQMECIYMVGESECDRFLKKYFSSLHLPIQQACHRRKVIENPNTSEYNQVGGKSYEWSRTR